MGLAVCLVVLCGCRSGLPPPRYETLAKQRPRDTARAQRLNAEGLEHIANEDYAAAERAFRAALEADLLYPAAHNNICVCLLHDQRWYEAAWECQFGAKLAPQAVEPRANLALIYEHVGQLDKAEDLCRQALEIDPHSIEVMGHLARVQVKANKKDETLRELLQELAFRGDGSDWDVWARRQLVMWRD